VAAPVLAKIVFMQTWKRNTVNSARKFKPMYLSGAGDEQYRCVVTSTRQRLRDQEIAAHVSKTHGIVRVEYDPFGFAARL
jgi:hypothetical protein